MKSFKCIPSTIEDNNNSISEVDPEDDDIMEMEYAKIESFHSDKKNGK